ncbi:hypothetical protein GCM10023184_36010 [Flaviaesturariibacter amylovorans]|uniref:UVR domain-containing protein n=1 Tax=Flaviaesturariibacter amylovorans TaxID=1084520 RepID=A0ABP8HGM5_9BACT
MRGAYLRWGLGLFGLLGWHRRYLGKHRTARLWLCTAGLLGVGALADAFLLRWLVRRHNLGREIVRVKTRIRELEEQKTQLVEAHRFEEAALCRDQQKLLGARLRELSEGLR